MKLVIISLRCSKALLFKKEVNLVKMVLINRHEKFKSRI